MYKKLIKQFVNNIDSDIKVKFLKGKCGLFCEPENYTIFIGFEYNAIDANTFYSFCKELEPKLCNTVQIDQFITGILHEIGHLMTHDDEKEDDYNESVELLNTLYQTKTITEEEMNKYYVRLDLEQLATKWALDFIKNNYNYFKYYQEKIGREINKHFEKIDHNNEYVRVVF